MRDESPAIGGHCTALVTLDDHERLVGRRDVEVAAGIVHERLGFEDLGQLRGRALLGEPSAHGSKSSIVRAMDESRPPSRTPDPRVGGPLTRDEALAMLERAGELLASGEFQAAGEHYARVVGFDEPAITAAALLGLGEVRYRLDDESAAVATWSAVLRLGETPSTYPAWRNIAAARVREGELKGAIDAYREADRGRPARTSPRSPTGSAG